MSTCPSGLDFNKFGSSPSRQGVSGSLIYRESKTFVRVFVLAAAECKQLIKGPMMDFSVSSMGFLDWDFKPHTPEKVQTVSPERGPISQKVKAVSRHFNRVTRNLMENS